MKDRAISAQMKRDKGHCRNDHDVDHYIFDKCDHSRRSQTAGVGVKGENEERDNEREVSYAWCQAREGGRLMRFAPGIKPPPNPSPAITTCIPISWRAM